MREEHAALLGYDAAPVRAVFRVDASSTIGSGHLSRCLTLARALVNVGAEVTFATRAPSEHTRGWIVRERHRIVEVTGDDEAAASRVAAGDAELVIIDGYTFGTDVHDALRGPARTLCVIDDTATSPVHADVVLNGNLFAEQLSYPHAKRALLGPSYALVREEFSEARGKSDPDERSRRSSRRVLVSMGGADPAGATEAFLEALNRDVAECEVVVIVGGANPRLATIRAMASRVTGHRVEVRADVARMSEPMLWCDVAVVAAGSTCLGLACLGVPSVVVAVADNQEPVAAELVRRGLMRSVGRFSDGSGRDLVRHLEEILVDSKGRETAAMRQRATVDGRGAWHAAAALVG